MKAQWIRKTDGDRVLLFFNGWGQDAHVLSQAPLPDGWDLLMLFDYTNLQVPADATACLESAGAVVLAAWSMGVWAAGTLHSHAHRIAGSVAINGTGQPIHDDYGIPPALYLTTVASFSESNRLSFFRRMCGTGEALRRYLADPPARDLADQHRELAAIETQATQSQRLPEFPFRTALVGAQDRIIPPASQERYWKERIGCQTLDMPHLPFPHLQWKDLIAHAGYSQHGHGPEDGRHGGRPSTATDNEPFESLEGRALSRPSCPPPPSGPHGGRPSTATDNEPFESLEGRALSRPSRKRPQ